MKMNWAFKVAFILLMFCIPAFAGALIFAYLLEEVYLSAVFSAGGAFLMFVGIIFAMFSKPKKPKERADSLENEKTLN